MCVLLMVSTPAVPKPGLVPPDEPLKGIT
jgi:hypothetical protein